MSLRVIDFFCGCGGTSAGFRAAGMNVILGLDFDRDAKATYVTNFPEAAFIGRDIRTVGAQDLEPFVGERRQDLVFCGCAPCQPFSKVKTTKRVKDDRTDLLSEFGRFVLFHRPAYVVVENVPGIQRPDMASPLHAFVAALGAAGYDVRHEVVGCHRYGVPQTRRRLLLIASLSGTAPWPQETNGPGQPNPNYSTVWDWIKDFPAIKAGEEHAVVPNHRAASLSSANLKRIRATLPGKGRECWPPDIRLKCHVGHRGHTDVYGRLRKEQPAAALTTRCTSLSNGRFGHPEQDRAISVREAASLQTFDRGFLFCGSLGSMARQIGNAVPVELARQIGLAIVADWETRTRCDGEV